MSTRSIEVVGTFQGCWTSWVREVFVGVGHAEVHADPSTWQRLDAFLRSRLGSNVLVLVEHPAIGLAYSLSKGEDIDPEAWLDDWLASARTLLAYVQRNAETTLVVNADEAQRRPLRLAQLLRSRWGELFAMPSRVVVQDYRPDALIHAVTWSFIERDPGLQEVVPELMGTCVALPGLRSANTRFLPEGLVDGAEVASRLGDLVQAERHLAQLKGDRETETEALRGQLKTVAGECERLAAAVQALETGRDTMMARTDAADRALAEARSRLEAEIQERNALAARLAAAASQQESLVHELSTARQNAAAVQQQFHEGQLALVRAEEQRNRMEQEVVHAAEQRIKLERQLADSAEQQIALGQELAQAAQLRHALEQELAQATAQRNALEQELAQAAEQRRTLEQELAQATAQRNSFEQELAQAVEQQRALEQELAQATARRNALEQELTQTAERRSMLEQELKLAGEQRNCLVHDLAQAVEQRSTCEQELIQATVLRSALAQDLTQALENRNRNEQQLAQATDQLDKLERELVEGSKQRSSLEQELAHASRQRGTLEQELGQATKQRRTVEQELASAAEQRRVLEQELAQASKQRRTLEQELAQSAKQRSALEQNLAKAEELRDKAEQDLASSSRRRSALEHELSKAKEQRNALEQERAPAKAAARASAEEVSLLLKQLHQMHEELERLVERHDAENASLAARIGPSQKELQEDLRSAREESELLALQTQQVQQELERVHAEKVRLAQEVKSQVAFPGLDNVTIGELTVESIRDTPPHRELSFVVHQVRAGERQVAGASLRLVEHWGRPGLVVFSEDGRAPLFDTWRENGREDGRPYMLLVHGEESAQAVYDAMGTLDWQLTQALVVRLGQALQDHACDLSPAWRSIAQRLLTSLHEHPARLRYNNVVATPAEWQPEGARYDLVLERVSFKGRTWQRLPIQWQPNGPTPSLSLESDEQSGPPLLAWPTEADGTPVRRLRLPLGDDAEALEIRAVWDTLSGTDRTFVAEVLNLMPILAVHMQAAAASNGKFTDQLDLQAAATDTMLFGRAALQPLASARPQAERRRPLLQRMARRLGVSAETPPSTATAI